MLQSTWKSRKFWIANLSQVLNYKLEWVNRVKHVKVCAKCHHKTRCLKGIDLDFCDDNKPCCPCDKRECLPEANECENK